MASMSTEVVAKFQKSRSHASRGNEVYEISGVMRHLPTFCGNSHFSVTNQPNIKIKSFQKLIKHIHFEAAVSGIARNRVFQIQHVVL